MPLARAERGRERLDLHAELLMNLHDITITFYDMKIKQHYLHSPLPPPALHLRLYMHALAEYWSDASPCRSCALRASTSKNILLLPSRRSTS